MTDDQQFILGCLTLILPTVASIFAYRKTSQTHEAVNGMQAKKERLARKSGRAAGKASQLRSDRETMGQGGNPSQGPGR